MAATVLNTTAGLTGKTLMITEGAETITGLKTFDRDPSAPFAVTGSSAKVTNLDADKLDGYEAAALAVLAEDETVTGNWIFSGTVALPTLTQNLVFTDASYDIGASGATRPRDLFLSRNAVIGGTLGVTGVATFTSVPVFSAGLGSAAWPIGSVFIAIVATNPATLLGFGTWSAFGTGRVLVGYDSGDADFDTAEETGGAKTHTLTEAEMPVHTHVQNAHGHSGGVKLSQLSSTGTTQWVVDEGGSEQTWSDMALVVDTAVAVNQNAGSGSAHNNVQPYITVYMWKRTA